MVNERGGIATIFEASERPFTGPVQRIVQSLGSFKGALAVTGLALAAFATKGIGSAISAAARFETQTAELGKLLGQDIAGPIAESVANLGNQLPVARDQLFEVTEIAARLGIRGRQNLLNFTETAAMLGVATDLAASEAADAFARILKQTRTPIEAFDNLGSVFNELANIAATSTSEIVDSVRRAAPELARLGIPVQDIAAISATLNEVSESATRAGTRLRRFAQELSNPQNIETFARALGLTRGEFIRLREQDPTSVIVELARVMREGGFAATDLAANLDSRVRQALAALGQNFEGLNRLLGEARREFVENNSLQEEFAVFAGTSASRSQVLTNRIEDLRSEVGESFLPVWKDVLSVTADVVGAFGEFAELPLEDILPAGELERTRDALQDILVLGREFAELRGIPGALGGIQDLAIVPILERVFGGDPRTLEAAAVDQLRFIQQIREGIAEEGRTTAVNFIGQFVRTLGARGDRLPESELQAAISRIAGPISVLFERIGEAADDAGQRVDRSALGDALDDLLGRLRRGEIDASELVMELGDLAQNADRFVTTLNQQQEPDVNEEGFRLLNELREDTIALLEREIQLTNEQRVRQSEAFRDADVSLRARLLQRAQLLDRLEKFIEVRERAREKLEAQEELLARIEGRQEKREANLRGIIEGNEQAEQSLLRQQLIQADIDPEIIDRIIARERELEVLQDQADEVKEQERATRRLQRRIDRLTFANVEARLDLLVDTVDELSDAFIDFIVDSISGAQSLGDALIDVIQRVVREIIEQQLQGLLLSLFGGLFGFIGGGGGGGGANLQPVGRSSAAGGFALSGGGGGGGGFGLSARELGQFGVSTSQLGRADIGGAMRAARAPAQAGPQVQVQQDIVFSVEAIDQDSVKRFFNENGREIVNIVATATERSTRVRNRLIRGR